MRFLGTQLNPTTDLVVGRDATITGNISANVITATGGNIGAQGSANPSFYLTSSTDGQQWQFGANGAGHIAGFYDITNSRWLGYWSATDGAMTVPAALSVGGTISASNLSGTNTGNQTITLSGDVTGSGTGSFAATLANTAVSPGTYTSLTVNSKGLITAGTNPVATISPVFWFNIGVV